MAIIVQKFGGSCLVDADAVKNAARIITGEYRGGNSVVAVVSAQGDTTDRLIRRADEISKRPPKRELDVLMSAGEQLSAALLAMAIGEEGCPCVALLGWQAGIVTNSVFGQARIRDIQPDRIKKELSQKKIVLVAGFQGVDRKNNMTTLGRGGSDTTAVAGAYGIGADVCEIYSDVDGVFTIRPAVAPSNLLKGLEINGADIVVDRSMATNKPGCFAAGDCTGRPYQLTKAVGEGNVAAHSIVAYLAERQA